jgi:ABC-2 type transport system permease protein
MRNYWLVAKHEYRNTVVKRGFILLTVGVPLGLVALIGLVILVEGAGQSSLPVGYVDQAGILDPNLQANLPDPEDRIQVRAFPDETSALAALEREEVQAVFVFPPSYPQTLHTEIYYLEKPPSDQAWGDLDDFVRINLVAELTHPLRDRLIEGPTVTVHDIASNREFSESSVINILLPFIATFFFFFATMMASGYMMGVVATEKESRTMEVMLTSVTPGQLIGGKAAGLLAAALTQLAIYAVAAIVGILVAARYIPELQRIVVPWTYLGIMALFFLPAFGLISAIMVAIGGAVTELDQGQQIGGILNLFFMLPIFLLPILFENPNHPLMVLFTLFPTTSFLTISLRWGLGTIPLWQIGLSWVILVASMLIMIWAAARIFRAGMLRYGQPLTLKGALAAIRR